MNNKQTVQLVPMTEGEFETFMKISMQNHSQDQVKAGFWKAEEAEVKMGELRSQVLPDGLGTPGHFFYSIEDAITSNQVGGLWYLVLDQDGEKFFFVLDIQIDNDHRRLGYGTQAFLAMEDNAREIRVSRIVLQVFKHNTPARAMYEKLGYLGDGDQMIKEITSSAP